MNTQAARNSLGAEKAALIILIGVFAGLLFFEFPGTWLFSPDEARYAEIPLEMLQTGDFVTPHLNGTKYFEKPPLLYWCNATAMTLFGKTPYAARLTSRLAMVGTALVLIIGLASSANLVAGLWAGFFYLSFPFVFAVGRLNITDPLLTFFLTAAFFSMHKIILRREESLPAWPYELAFGAASGCAFLTKGLVGFVFPSVVLVIWSLTYRRWQWIKWIAFSWAPVMAVVVSLPWIILVTKANLDFPYIFFIREHVLRFATRKAERAGPIYYFLISFAVGIVPVFLFFVSGVRTFFNQKKILRTGRSFGMFSVIWLFSILLFFSFSKSKLIPYILPCFPAAAAFMGLRMDEMPLSWRPLWKWQFVLFSILAAAVATIGYRLHIVSQYGLYLQIGVMSASIFSGALGGWLLSMYSMKKAFIFQSVCWATIYFTLILGLPKVAKDYSEHHLVQSVFEIQPDQVVSYKTYAQGFPVELGAPVPVVDYQGELASNDEKPSTIFWSNDQFWSLWKSDKKMAVVIRKEQLGEFTGDAKTRIIAQYRRFALVTNYEPPVQRNVQPREDTGHRR